MAVVYAAAKPGIAPLAYSAPLVAAAPAAYLGNSAAVYSHTVNGLAAPYVAGASYVAGSPYVAAPYVASPYSAYASPYAYSAYSAPLLYK